MAFDHREPNRLSRALMQLDPANRRQYELRNYRALAEEFGSDDEEEKAQRITQRERNARERAAKARERDIKGLQKQLAAVEKEIAKKRGQGVLDSKLKGQFREADKIAADLRKLMTGR